MSSSTSHARAPRPRTSPRAARRLAAMLVVGATAAFAASATPAQAAPGADACIFRQGDSAFQFGNDGYGFAVFTPSQAGAGGSISSSGPTGRAAAEYLTSYAALGEGTSNGPSGTPPGVWSTSDAYDSWGELLVGGLAASDQYSSFETDNCTRSADGSTLTFPKLPLHGLQVQRSLFVSPGSGFGVRLSNTISNETSAPITTDVYVGALGSTRGGNLGSDNATRVETSSDGDNVMTPADRWAVTTDGGGYDPAVAHVWDGVGGTDRASVAQQGGVALDDPNIELGADDLGYGWKSVTVAPGESATFLSWSILRTLPGTTNDGEDLGTIEGRADGLQNASTERGLAVAAEATTAAKALQSAPATTLYDGFSAAQIKAVRNWARPAVGAAPITASGTTTARTFSVSTGDVSGGIAACATASTAWNFGDGQVATGASVEHMFAPGTYTVTAVTSNPCGGSTTSTSSVTIETPAAAPAAAPTTTPAPTLTAKVSKSVSRAKLLKDGLSFKVNGSEPGKLRVVLSGIGTKFVGTINVTIRTAGKDRHLVLKPKTALDRAYLRKAKKLRLLTRLTLADGTVLQSSRIITLK